MTDDYAGYNAQGSQSDLERLGCWAHAWCKFVQVQKVQTKGKLERGDIALKLIASVRVSRLRSSRAAMRGGNGSSRVERLRAGLTERMDVKNLAKSDNHNTHWAKLSAILPATGTNLNGVSKKATVDRQYRCRTCDPALSHRKKKRVV